MTRTSPAPPPRPLVADGPLTGPDRPIQEGPLAGNRSALPNVCAGGVPFGHEIDFRGTPMSPPAVHVHTINGYARHLGHADLLRERVDGVTGR